MNALSTQAPRYTSYPTAPHFSAGVDHEQYARWLSELAPESLLSVYVHIPFCHQLCWYCGCNTKAIGRHAPVAKYLRSVTAEIGRVAGATSARRVRQIHWGGGSPNILTADEIATLSDAIRANFHVEDDAEFAVEMDPRHLTEPQIQGFARAGISRLSLGVQDFDEVVQAAIGRHQSFEQTARAVAAFRDLGVGSINIDLIYGLPHQTIASAEQTTAKVISLAPDRIAVFGYAHLPQRLKHQRLIDGSALAGPVQRLAQSARMGQLLVEAGYIRIGLDHYAKPGDKLAAGDIARNFQGYTTDRCDALLGIGASAIGRLPQGYVQNAVAVGDYARRIDEHGLATAKGIALSSEDKARGYVIERLMCDLAISANDIRRRCGASAEAILDEAESLIADGENAGLVQRTADGFSVTEGGRPFLRSICAHFDAYLSASAAIHSSSV